MVGCQLLPFTSAVPIQDSLVFQYGLEIRNQVGLVTDLYANTAPCLEKKVATLFLSVTLRNANRFSKFFYHHTLQ